ncbi:MAG: glycosyl hydrolase 53 family protein [Bacteroidales bacterium]|nr:glycosyl hydrolase 53 family protein [Bacteroidales bacterium]
MIRFGYIILFCAAFLGLFSACQKDDAGKPVDTEEDLFIRAVDISYWPVIRDYHLDFYNLNGAKEDFIMILKNSGVNTIRLRLWVNPDEPYASLPQVNSFARTLQSAGFRIWLSLHYSDTWADPGQQQIPSAWLGAEHDALNDSVYNYTTRVVNQIKPDLIQIGNEINNGFLLPEGDIYSHKIQFLQLLNSGIEAVRNANGKTKIIIHYAGLEGIDWFLDQVSDLDFDVIGLSYYPVWHGKDLTLLTEKIKEITINRNHDVMIAETAYPFSLGWNDWTNNIVGLEEQLILPEFPASQQGQRDFILEIRNILSETERGLGFCYWGAELVAFDGPQSENGSSWENQAIFNFDNQALPVLEAFSKNLK